MPDTHNNFGHRLRAERERLGVSLETIEKKTKIKKTYFIGLENGDLSRWPAGKVFRRAYVRDYANAIGIPASPVVAEFVRLFPDGEAIVKVPMVASAPDTSSSRPAERLSMSTDDSPLTMTFDRESKWYVRLAKTRAMAAAVDTAALVTLGAVVGLTIGSSIWTAAGVLALVYFPATTAWFGRSLACWYLETYNPQLFELTPFNRPVVAAARAMAIQSEPEPEPMHESIQITATESVDADDLIDSVVLIPRGSQPAHATQEASLY